MEESRWLLGLDEANGWFRRLAVVHQLPSVTGSAEERFSERRWCAGRGYDTSPPNGVRGDRSASSAPYHRVSSNGPAKVISSRAVSITGDPDREHISTSFVERSHLTMRMSMRRFARLTNAFSKKIENHIAALSLYFIYYNFCRVHQTLRVTPAMEAGISDHVWEIEEIGALLN
jgi:hypothetical protein